MRQPRRQGGCREKTGQTRALPLRLLRASGGGPSGREGGGGDVERAAPSGQLVPASVSPLRDLSEVDTRPLGPGGPQPHPPALPTAPADTNAADIAALPTRRLTCLGERPPAVVPDPSPPQGDSMAVASH